MVVAPKTPQEEEEEETTKKVTNPKRRLLMKQPLTYMVYPPNSKWATPLQGTPPSFYRPRRGGHYNVG